MPRSHAPDPPEIRRQMIELVVLVLVGGWWSRPSRWWKFEVTITAWFRPGLVRRESGRQGDGRRRPPPWSPRSSIGAGVAIHHSAPSAQRRPAGERSPRWERYRPHWCGA